MRAETFMGWMFVGFWLLITGVLLQLLEVISELATFLTAMGFVYVGIGFVLAFAHDRHMAKRTRAGRE